ncbi:MAG: hypothetical protein LBL87_08020 [Ruminococcus sp.]|jgi:hypothetical protein|nr:hypothetical protein [Ruminococcus sp.]
MKKHKTSEKTIGSDENIFVFIRKYLPLAAALLVFLMSTGFIFIKIIGARRDNERWSDYDECGIF